MNENKMKDRIVIGAAIGIMIYLISKLIYLIFY